MERIKQFDYVRLKKSKSKRTGEVIETLMIHALVLWAGNKHGKWHTFAELERVRPTE